MSDTVATPEIETPETLVPETGETEVKTPAPRSEE